MLLSAALGSLVLLLLHVCITFDANSLAPLGHSLPGWLLSPKEDGLDYATCHWQ